MEQRASQVQSSIARGGVVSLPVSVDVESIVNILAVQAAGGVPHPYTGQVPAPSAVNFPDGALCVSTSGSDGLAKVVPFTHANIAAGVRASRSRLLTTATDRWLLCLPLDHVGGLSIIWRMLEAGGTMIVVPYADAAAALELLEPTVASLVPTMVRRLVESHSAELALLRFVLVGGAGLRKSLAETAAILDINLVPTYGMTETGSQVTTASVDPSKRVAGSSGTPLDGMTIEILESGAITVAGPAVFSGYLGEQLREGMFVTGDYGHLDPSGRLFISGRADDVIVSGGENVSLVRVAELISSIEGVDDVCVVGLHDDEWGMIPGAMVISTCEHSTVAEMIRGVTSNSQRPRNLVVRTDIPMLPNGKHDRAAVRSALVAGQSTV